MIHATRPFVVNEWIKAKIEGYEVSGTVEVCPFLAPCEASILQFNNVILMTTISQTYSKTVLCLMCSMLGGGRLQL